MNKLESNNSSNNIQPRSTFSTVMNHVANGTLRISSLMVCADALKMVGELALRGMDSSVKAMGFQPQQNKLLELVSGDNSALL